MELTCSSRVRSAPSDGHTTSGGTMHAAPRLEGGPRQDGETVLRIRELAGGAERWLKLPVQRDEQESRFTRDLLPGYAFTPDGKSVVAVYGGKIHRIDVTTGKDPVIP